MSKWVPILIFVKKLSCANHGQLWEQKNRSNSPERSRTVCGKRQTSTSRAAVLSFGKKQTLYFYRDIISQQLFNASGNIVIELYLKDGRSVSLQTAMDGVYPFLDTAFQRWCAQKSLTPEECDFYDPQKSWWFPHEES